MVASSTTASKGLDERFAVSNEGTMSAIGTSKAGKALTSGVLTNRLRGLSMRGRDCCNSSKLLDPTISVKCLRKDSPRAKTQ